MISVYGLKQTLADRRALIADVIFDCMQMSLGVPKQRHALRFDLLDAENFYPPINRSQDFIVIENKPDARAERTAQKTLN